MSEAKSAAVAGNELAGTVDMFDVGLFIGFSERRDKLNEELKQVEEDRNRVAARLAEQFILNGVQSINVDGYTLYKQLDTHVSVKQEFRQEAVDLAQALGLDDLISLQPQRFKSWYSEEVREGRGAGDFGPMVSVFEKVGIRMRKS